MSVPVTVLTGFLGAGKTTLLRALLRDPGGLKIGVLVNDFGEINIDAALVVEGQADSLTLSNGCVCCTIQTELVEAIEKLLRDRPDLDRIVIEASGVSRALPLADLVESEALAGRIRLDGMFCLVDAAGFPELDFAATELALDQITGADVILLNKADLVSEADMAALKSRLSGVQGSARMLPCVAAELPREVLFGAVERSAPRHHGHGPGCGCDHPHASGDHLSAFTSWSWHSAELLDEARLRRALRDIGRGLLRAKGVLRVVRGDGHSALLEYQQVGRRARWTEMPPGAEATESLLVTIGLGDAVDPDRFAALLETCRDGVAA
ncbi:CobW family GTP-binding protein [Salipiger mangrovisoli]|uniref:GTP-binding protein n=1 Tax=Salipiger mangrovisoli TaxID=2865933 RepID=A0ABR9X9N9_9RHOB|nr:GTP-binding protein [Salipiger mangrovisoli]MBE9640324.1 GTP-binding protein [Salipiger mangrovisoli]